MILVTGSLGFDHIMDFPGTFEENILPEELKTLSVSFLVDTLEKSFGGTAGNIAYNLGLLRQEVSILSSAGKDFGSFRKHLEAVGVKTDAINIVEDDSTASFFVITDKNNCQIAGFYPGAMRKDTTLKIEKKLNPRFVVISPTIPEAMTNFAKQSKRLGIPYLYSPAQQLVRLNKEQLLTGIDGAEVLVVNDYEMELLLNKAGLIREKLGKMVKIIVTTLGDKGSLIEKDGDSVHVAAAKARKVVDPTGAGDGYVAGFLAGYLADMSLKACGQLGGVVAVCSIEQYGTQNHRFTKQELIKRYRQNFKDSIKL